MGDSAQQQQGQSNPPRQGQAEEYAGQQAPASAQPGQAKDRDEQRQRLNDTSIGSPERDDG